MKRNLIVLLLIPFLIAILGVVTMSSTFNLVDADIVSIDWNYDDVEGFKYGNGAKYALYAKGVNQRGQEALNNELVWRVDNKDTLEEIHAQIVIDKGRSYLKTLSTGEVLITCSNVKGNVYRTFNGIIYDTGVILISQEISDSNSRIDPYVYFGDTDLIDGKETDASFKLRIRTEPAEMLQHVYVKEKTDNFEFDLGTGTVSLKRTILGGKAKLTLAFDDASSEEGLISSSYDFKIVNGGVNIYTYSDLLYVSNNNKIGVLRKSFESVDNAYVFNNDDKIVLENNTPVLKTNNVECFGYYDVKAGKTVFTKDSLYHFTTTYNKNSVDDDHGFISQWNSHYKDNQITDQIYCALRITNDFYGNGYTLNFHNLTYPSSTYELDNNGVTIEIPTLGKDDIYRGPLPFYSLGDHNTVPLIEALGQDNIGLYIDGDGITVNDLSVKNCDFGRFYDVLNTVGTVVDIDGDNVTIKNSKISSGKNVVRSYSNKNLTIKNCLLQYAKNFLFMTGSNEYIDINDGRTSIFTDVDGNATRSVLEEYLQPNAKGDVVMNNFLLGNFQSKDVMRKSLESIQRALNNADNLPKINSDDDYAGTTLIVDTMFYYASVASIGLEVLFNGPFLYSASPSYIANLLSLVNSKLQPDDEDFIPTHLSGISYPVKVSVKGDCRFYNYQTIDLDHNTVDGLDISGLINENITTIAAQALGEDIGIEINIDKFFPIKDYLFQACSPNKEVTKNDDGQFINVLVAWYGGGVNNSVVEFDLDNDLNSFVGPERKVDLTDAYLNLGSSGNGDISLGNINMGQVKNMILKAVTVVTGIEPFKFKCARNDCWYGEIPNINDLRENAKGE